LVATLVAGCSQSPAGPVSCGTTHTAAGVLVTIEVAKGSASCQTALQVEASYATMVKSGAVHGTGGGAPVSVGGGWTCQGYDTPHILATGDASECRDSTSTLLAILPNPTATPPTDQRFPPRPDPPPARTVEAAT
jgi:hypothetical protein